MTRTASCACGQLVATVEGEPVRTSVCHCHDCQKRTGSVFGTQARFPQDRVTINGRSRAFTRRGDSGSEIRFNFCPDCGSTVYYQLQQLPDLVAIAVGCFADSTFPAPRVSVYERRMHPWVQVGCALEHED